MNRPRSRTLLLAAALALATAIPAQAGSVTGNPNADGWTFNGNSLALGTFAYADPSQHYSDPFNFDVYSTSFELEAGSALLSANWLAGDSILGIGATVASGAVLTPQVRFLAKFGASDATFRASTYAPPGGQIPSKPWTNPPYPPNSESANFFGDGVGSGKYSGEGGIIVETPQIWGGQHPWFNETNAGQIILITSDENTNYPDPVDPNHPNAPGSQLRLTKASRNQWDSLQGKYVQVDMNSYGVAKVIYQLDDSSGLLSSYEAYLNVSLLAREGFTAAPAPGDKFVLAMQNLDKDFLKATGRTPGAVPEPSSVILAALGLGGLGLAALRRRPRASA